MVSGLSASWRIKSAACGDGVPEPLGVAEGAIVPDPREIQSAGTNQFVALFGGHPRPQAIGPRHLGENERCKRAAEALDVRTRHPLQEPATQRLQRGEIELAAAHPGRQRLEGDAIANLRLRVAETAGEREGQFVTLKRVGHFEPVALERVEAGQAPSGRRTPAFAALCLCRGCGQQERGDMK